jgi:hypothetical protein
VGRQVVRAPRVQEVARHLPPPTILSALANGMPRLFWNFIGAESVKVVADPVRVSRAWMVPFGRSPRPSAAVSIRTGSA